MLLLLLLPQARGRKHSVMEDRHTLATFDLASGVASSHSGKAGCLGYSQEAAGPTGAALGAVFDGHGGWLTAEHAATFLPSLVCASFQHGHAEAAATARRPLDPSCPPAPPTARQVQLPPPPAWLWECGSEVLGVDLSIQAGPLGKMKRRSQAAQAQMRQPLFDGSKPPARFMPLCRIA